MDWSKVLDAASTQAKLVGKRIREEVYSDRAPNISHKGISDLVTEIDIWSEAQIADAVATQFPNHVLVGEETSSQLSETRSQALIDILNTQTCWVVDPLDGTSNFSNKIPHSAVSIGIIDRGTRVAGVVYDPFRDELFTAIRQEGAYLNSKRIKTSAKDELIQCLVAIGFPNDRWTKWSEYRETTEKLIMSCRNVRAMGAAAIEISWVACGRLDAFFEYSIKPWDVAAASLIVAEAGGKEYSLNNPVKENFSLFGSAFLFSAPAVFEQISSILPK